MDGHDRDAVEAPKDRPIEAEANLLFAENLANCIFYLQKGRAKLNVVSTNGKKPRASQRSVSQRTIILCTPLKRICEEPPKGEARVFLRVLAAAGEASPAFDQP